MASASMTRSTPVEDDLDRSLAAVRAALRRDHGASVPAAELDALVARFAEEFAGATVRDYLGILIERRCRQSLRTVTADPARQ